MILGAFPGFTLFYVKKCKTLKSASKPLYLRESHANRILYYDGIAGKDRIYCRREGVREGVRQGVREGDCIADAVTAAYNYRPEI